MAEIELRPCLKAFALAMEQKLRENDYKGGWDDVDLLWLTVKAMEELGEWSRSLLRRGGTPDEAADLGNIVMMLWDKASRLKGQADG